MFLAEKTKADEQQALMVDFEDSQGDIIPPVQVICPVKKGTRSLSRKMELTKGSKSSAEVLVDRNRLLCSARLAVLMIALALVLATCSVWLCWDIRAMQMKEASLVKQLKDMIEGLYNKGAFNTNELANLKSQLDSTTNQDDSSDEEFPELNYEKLLRMLDYDETTSLASISTVETTQKLPEEDNFKVLNGLSSVEVTRNEAKCDLVADSWKFDCYPETGANEGDCVKRGCCWNPSYFESGSPSCFYPQDYPSYVYLNKSATPTGFVLYLNLSSKLYYPDPVTLLKMDVIFETKSRLHIKILDPKVPRYEVPTVDDPTVVKAADPTDYDVKFLSNWGFQVVRKSSGEIIFDASVGAFFFCDQFIQLSAVLPSTYVYGLGQKQGSFVQDFDWSRFTLFNADQIPHENANLYGSHPFYLMMESNGQSNGVFLLNSNALEITLQPTPAITYRTIGGILDFYFFMGPSPSDVVHQYLEIVGLPALPPYWSLGFHLCRFNYGTAEQTRAVWKRTRDAGIPFDVQWNDLDYMQIRRDFTVDEEKFGNLTGLVYDIHSVGMHYVPIIDCAIGIPKKEGEYPTYDEGNKLDIFVKDEMGNNFVGQVWPGDTVWPDFTNRNASNFWAMQFELFYKKVPIDGAWIDMNEPANFLNGGKTGCSGNRWDNPPYLPRITGDQLSHKTLCMSAQQHASIHYNVHNIYGYTESQATNYALTYVRNKRPFTISRSSFPGLGRYAGAWSGDVVSEWHDMRRSISDLLNFALFGIPLSGTDICGFNGNTTVKLCQRWMELGSFYPFSRNHNTDDAIDQDPVALGPEVVNSSVNALTTRYRFLPYLYTLFYRASIDGSTVVRPLFFEFPSDKKTYTIDTQFLWGAGLMILPVLDEDVTVIYPYFPSGIWYLLPSQRNISSVGSTYEVDSPLDTITVALRGGYILPTQAVNQTTTASRRLQFGLVAALNESGEAIGELYWDDGEFIVTDPSGKYNIITFGIHKDTLTSDIKNFKYVEESMILGNVTIHGIKFVPKNITINGDGSPFQFNNITMVLELINIKLDLSKSFTIIWK
ncbi:hypothetical protein CHUAL_008703 [Chamberlinius hualienensis]